MYRFYLHSAALFLALFTGVTVTAHAGVTTTQDLSFGEYMVTNNTGVKTVTINADGSSSASAGLVEITPPEEGIYIIDGLPANDVIASIDVSVSSLMADNGHVFTMDNFSTISGVTDGAGVATISLGASVHTSGTGESIRDGTYTGELDLQFNF